MYFINTLSPPPFHLSIQEEIEEAFQSDFLTKEFWSDEDNLDMLQAILGILYIF